MRHQGDTASGHINDFCKNYYHPMDPQLSTPAWRQGAPRFIVAGVCFLLVLIVFVLIGWQLSKEHDDQTPTYRAGLGQAWVENKIKETSPADKGSKEEKDQSTVCDLVKTWPPSKYAFKEHEKVYFQYYWEPNGSKIELPVSNDSQIMQRISYQRKTETSTNPESTIQPKTILTLSLFDNKEDSGKCDKKNKDVQQYCNFITDESQIGSADAVIFREQDLNRNLENLPTANHSRQIWIYNTMTPNQRNSNVNFHKMIFNLTSTYDFKSHIPMLPMYWEPKHDSKEQRKFTQKGFTNKVILVVYNKNCEVEKEFYKKYKDVIGALEEDSDIIIEWFNYYICDQTIVNITRLSDCLNLTSAECYKKIGPNKKFALAFEVSNADYISERFFHPLSNTVIPIAIGSTRIKYEAVSPKNSFIYFCDYEISKLRNLLKRLNSKKEELEGYFSWWINNEGEFKPFSRWYCQVCFMLHRAANLTTTVDDINRWRGID